MGDFHRHSGDEDGDEDEERGGPMLGFLFGNVDVAGDLDEEYLDQDVKEHLSALAGQLKDSLVDIKESDTVSDFNEEPEDYARKAENAIDYEDIEEEYEGPEVQVQSQDEVEISQAESYYAQAALERPSIPIGEDENYDEDEDYDQEEKTHKETQDPDISNDQEQKLEHLDHHEAKNTDDFEEGSMELPWTQEDLDTVYDQLSAPPELEENSLPAQKEADSVKITPRHELPVLYEEDGKEVLKFSELFGQPEVPWVCRKDKKLVKHPLPKGKPAQLHLETLEEDEDLLLKSGPITKAAVDEWISASIDSEDIDDDEELGESTEKMASKQRQNSFQSAQPMKEQGDWHSILERIYVPSPNLQLIHQEDWEQNILWDERNSEHVREDPSDIAMDTSGSIEENDVDTRQEDAFCIKDKEESWQEFVENPHDIDTKSNMNWLASRIIMVEPLSQKSCPQNSTSNIHPRLLRLERLPGLTTIDKEMGLNGQSDSLSKISFYFHKMNLHSSDIISGGWLDDIIWDDEKASSKKSQNSKVIFNLQDDQMVFEVPEGKDTYQLKSHASAMLITSQLRVSGNEGGDTQPSGYSSLQRFNISNDKYYMNKKNPQQQKSNMKKRNSHGIKILHSTPAAKLQTMKPKLTNKDLAYFHRPKAVWYPHHNEVAAKEQGKLSVSGPMKIILKSMGGKGSKLTVDASDTLDTVKIKSAKKFGDLKNAEKTKIFYCGKELKDDINLSQQDVRPNSVLHLVRTKVHPWPKAQRLPGESKPTRPPGAFKRKSELSVKDGHVFITEYCEERPLLLNNVGMGARLCTYYRKVSPTDSTASTLRNDRGAHIGVPIPIEPMEDSPFLGDIRPGDSQICLETNMFRAPAFHHKVPHTDFLLVRSAKGKLSLRRIDRCYAIGQQEPHMEVFTPTSKTVQNHLHNRLMAYIYREFRNNEKPGAASRLRADEVIAQFPALTEGFLRKRLRHFADLQRTAGGEMWWIKKDNCRIPTEEEIRRMVSPESVCAYESMQAGLYHLKRMGVSKLTVLTGLSTAMNQLPDEALVLAAASHIERELQITPWNLSYNFVAATMQGRGTLERLEITGPGDPSGRGLGFSYLKAAPKPPSSSALVEKKAAAARGGGAVTGTDADLRRLSMDAAREVLLKFNVPESHIDKLTRWHRIALVRKLSSEQAASGVKLGATTLNKFARGQRMSFLQLQQQTRERCQEIWDRQVKSLSAEDGENSESEGEENEDLDSFAGDLENLLEAEEGEAEEVASLKSKKDAIRGTNARRRALEAQREEDIEDEEAEAAELRRMLMEDDEADDVKKKKKIVSSEKVPAIPPVESKIVSMQEGPSNDIQDGNKAAGSKKKKIIKRIIRTKHKDGTYTSREVLITDPEEVAKYLEKKNASQNGIPVKGSGTPKKTYKAGFQKDAKKAKKPTKNEGGTGIQLICGACKQVGHMRTNKKVCPMYTEEGKANTHKVENIDTNEPSVRPGIKITLKSSSAPSQEKELQEKEQHEKEPQGKEEPVLPVSNLPAPKITLKNVGTAKEKDEVILPVSNAVTPKITVRNINGVSQEKEREQLNSNTSATPKITLKSGITALQDKGKDKEKDRSVPLNNQGTPKVYLTSGVGALEEKKEDPSNLPSSHSQVTPKVTLKTVACPVPEKQQPTVSLNATTTPKTTPKVLSFKIKLPASGNVDVTVPSTSKVSDSHTTPVSAGRSDVQKGQGGQSLIKKIKVHKSSRTPNNAPQDEGMKFKNMDNWSHKEMPHELDKKVTVAGSPEWFHGKYSEIGNKADFDSDSDGVPRKEILVREHKEQLFQTETEEEIRRRKERKKQKKEKKRRREEERLKQEQAEQQRLLQQKEQEGAQRQRHEREWKEVEQKRRQELELRKRQERQELEERNRQQWKLREMEEKKRQERKTNEIEERRRLEKERRQEEERERLQRLMDDEDDEDEDEHRQFTDRLKKVKKDNVAVSGKRSIQRERRPMDQVRISAKRRASFEEDLYSPATDHSHQTKRRKAGEVLLANILENIVDTLKRSNSAILFLKPVQKKEAPDYYDVIKHPMDLSTIREKARKLMYRSRDDFRNDVWQIAENAHIYNDLRNPHIPPLADEILELCDEELYRRAPELDEAESTIERVDNRSANRKTIRPY